LELSHVILEIADDLVSGFKDSSDWTQKYQQ
jgi:hypothetical protein